MAKVVHLFGVRRLPYPMGISIYVMVRPATCAGVYYSAPLARYGGRGRLVSYICKTITTEWQLTKPLHEGLDLYSVQALPLGASPNEIITVRHKTSKPTCLCEVGKEGMAMALRFVAVSYI